MLVSKEMDLTYQKGAHIEPNILIRKLLSSLRVLDIEHGIE